MARLTVAFPNFAHGGPHRLAAEGRYTAVSVQQQMADCLLPYALYSNVQPSKGYLTFIFNKSSNFL